MTDTVDKKFPFLIGDLKAWVVKRKDGTVVKYTLVENRVQATDQTKQNPAPKSSFGDMCVHGTSPLPVFATPGHEGKGTVELRIANAGGIRAAYINGTEDLIIDAGDVFTPYAASPLLTGNARDFIDSLYPYADEGLTEILKIKWDDRMAPDLHPQFFIELGELLKKKAAALAEDNLPYRMMINCVGGHGRSGTGLVCLMMYYSDYSALDAITHLRAVHCPRAIESVVQHEYINMFADYLGREANAKEAQAVKNFKERFLELTCETSKPYRERMMINVVKEVSH